jgi:ABC-type glycerol-3-phosphate transport system permease component
LYQSAFRSFRFGPAAAIASIILLVTLALGVVAGLLVVLTRLRLTTVNTLQSPEQADQQIGRQRSKVLPAIVLALTLLPTLGVCSLSVPPFGWLVVQSFGEGGFVRLLEQISAGRILVNTFIPPFVTAVVQLLAAYPAALSIGALRPLGKRSEWLLLLFSPWLFVTLLPLSLVSVMAAKEMGTLNTFVGLISPILFSVPTLFILTVFFMGQAPHWQRASTDSESSKSIVFFRHLVLPSLPLVGVLLLFLLFISWQDIFWPLVVNTQQEYYPLSVTLLRLLDIPRGGIGILAAAIILFIVPISFFYYVALILFQMLYLDRLVLYSDDR